MNINEDISIRKQLHPNDIKAVEEIVISTGFFRDDEVKVARELVEERISKGPASGYEFIFAEINNRTIAYSCYGLIPCTLRSYDLYWIVTHRDVMGKGIGSRILKLTEEEIKNAGGIGIYVETSSTNKYLPTRMFYEKNNYLLKARFEDFYDLNDDKIVYTKYLKQKL